MKRILFALLVITLCCSSCAGQQKKETSVETKKERGFQLPEVPVMLDTPEARATFVCEHFWDYFDFADTAYIHLPDMQFVAGSITSGRLILSLSQSAKNAFV